ncbi:MAG: TolC family protein [Gemmatimonadota bacterium]|nr:TolC family protein [Gemmatimonadota bacterium]
MNRSVIVAFARGAAAGVVAVAVVATATAGMLHAQSAEAVTLDRAIATALANSRAVAEAEAGLVAAGGRVREAWASVLPDVSASASYQRNLKVQEIFLPAVFFDSTAAPGEFRPVRVGADNSWAAGVTVSQPLFEVGAFIGVGAAGRFRALEAERARGVTQSVVTQVRQRYFDVLLALESVRLTELSVERVRQTLAETQALNRAGLASNYDVLRLEVQLANLEPNLRRARDGTAAAKRTLLVEMGRGANESIELVGRLYEVDITDLARNAPENARLVALAGPEISSSELRAAYDTALARRTDVRQVELNLELERARLAVERAEYFPTVSLFGAYNVNAQEDGGLSFFGENANQRTTTAWGGIRVEVPIFRGFSQSARMQQARAAITQNRARLELTREQAADQLRTLVDALAESRQRVVSQRRAVEQAQRGFEIASAEYRAGVGSQLQITDAEVALRQSEFNYAQAVYDYLIARTNLDAARGTVPERAGELVAARND